MRFFAHDGKAVHGPAVLEELLKLPGFDGDTLVCPVGSENSADWRPALSYPPFREALLAAAPRLAPPPPPPPPPPALPCPRCARANPEDARFCNACAARMDGREEPPAPEPAPAFIASDASASPPEPAPDLVELEPALSSEVRPPVEELAPAPQTVSPPSNSPWRKTLIASFAGAALAGSGLGWWLLRPAKRVAAAVPDSSPKVPAPQAPVSPPPPAAAAPPVTTAPPAPIPPASPAASAPQAPAKRARRKPRVRKPAPKQERTPTGSPPASAEPVMPGGAPAGGALLPGLPRLVPPKSAPKPKADAAAPDAASAADAAEDGATQQVREQFGFCAQLLSQGAYADHFDTCLCAEARQAAPYRGRRGDYARALKKAAAAGTLETSAAVTGIVLDGPIARVTADWQSGASEKPRTETENWQLEDGLWCRNP